MSVNTLVMRIVTITIMALGGLFIGRAFATCTEEKQCASSQCFYTFHNGNWGCWLFLDEEDNPVIQSYMAYAFFSSSGSLTTDGSVDYEIRTSCNPCDAGSGNFPQEAVGGSCTGNLLSSGTTTKFKCT